MKRSPIVDRDPKNGKTSPQSLIWGKSSEQMAEAQFPSCYVKICNPLTQRLELPPVFMSRHGERLSGDVLLIDRVGDTWEAKLSRSRGSSWLHQMSVFGDHYSVQAGDVIIFQLVGYSQLLVTVFDHNGMEMAAGRRD